jgi:GntR family transcriptional regulator, transcriptional repressor for pyruvate dehydrogenase complex
MAFEAINRVLVWRQIADQIGSAIIDGTLAPGEELPTERELCERFGVSRASTREALRVLEAQGLIMSNDVHVRTVAAYGASSALHQALEQLIHLQAVTMNDLVDFRCLLECQGVRMAAERRDKKALAEARKTLEEAVRVAGEGPGGDSVVSFEAADIQFHLALISASGSEVMTVVMQALRSTVTRRLYEVLSSSADAHEAVQTFNAAHAAILEAVENGDGEAAAEHMERHIRDAYAHAMSGGRPKGRKPR